jgi:Reverse transcriptase (RNA-dependent DNA polymerase)
MAWGYSRNYADSRLYSKWYGSDLVLNRVYVGEIIVAADNKEHPLETQSRFQEKFSISMFGSFNCFYGIEYIEDQIGITHRQIKFIKNIRKKFYISEAEKVTAPILFIKTINKMDGED